MVNDETIQLVKDYEGLVLTAYPDPGSKNGLPWTIGYGHTSGVKKGDVITAEQAEEYLKIDLNSTVQTINKYVKVVLNDNQLGALTSFVYNIGEGQFVKSSVLTYINENKFDSVPGRMALYRLNDGKVMPGLVRRRSAEGTLWMKPVGETTGITEVANVEAAPATVKKPWDWGLVGGVATTVAATSSDIKTAIGNITETFGLNPIWLLIAIALGFAGYTLYHKVIEK